MKGESPLSDSWLFWDAERLDEFPHGSEGDSTPTAARDGADGGMGGSSPRNLLEGLLLYVGGLSAAILGMGVVIMIGSFISAYSALSSSGESRPGAGPAQVYPGIARTAPYAKSAPAEAIVLGPGRAETATGGEARAAGGGGSLRRPPSTRGPG